jgi:hypothetical protein
LVEKVTVECPDAIAEEIDFLVVPLGLTAVITSS